MSQDLDSTQIGAPPPPERYDPLPESDGPPRGIGAARQHPFLIAFVAIIFAAAGAFVGYSRPATYTSSAVLQVGKVNPNSPGFSGFTQSASDLATLYSRAAVATQVLNTIQKKTGLAPLVAASRISSAPIPEAPAFQVFATGSTARAAVALANVAAAAVVTFESSQTVSRDAGHFFALYTQAAQAQARDQGYVSELQRQHVAAGSMSLVNAQAKVLEDLARSAALGAAYQQAVLAQPPSNLVSILSDAITATGGRSRKTELYGFVGLIVGLVLGYLMSLLLEQRRAPTVSG